MLYNFAEDSFALGGEIKKLDFSAILRSTNELFQNDHKMALRYLNNVAEDCIRLSLIIRKISIFCHNIAEIPHCAALTKLKTNPLFDFFESLLIISQKVYCNNVRLRNWMTENKMF